MSRSAPPKGHNDRRSWHLRTNAVVLFYVTAALTTLVLRDLLLMPRWLAVHLLLLGAATNAIVTWSEHFAVALLRGQAPSRRLSAARLAALNLAVLGVLVGVAAQVPSVVVAAATLLVGVVIAHIGSLVLIARHALMGRFAATVRFYLVAGVALVVGVTFGALMVVGGELAGWHEQLHAAHVHANIFGWVGLSVLGTLFTLWPTVLRTRMVDGVMAAARRSLWLLTVGLAVSVGGFALDLRWVAVAGLTAYGVGVGSALQPFVQTWRRKAPHDAAAWSLAGAMIWLVAAVAADIVLLFRAQNVPSYVRNLDGLVPALVVGFVLQTLVGALTYLVPVVRGGGPAVLRISITGLARGWRVRVVALNVGVLILALGGLAWLPTQLTRAGWVLVGVPVAAFVWLVASVLLP